MVRAVELVEHHGADIEFDLAGLLGVDLHEFARGDRPWSQFVRLVDRLPAHSRYGAAVREDEDLASQLLELPEEIQSTPFTPSFVGWTPERELLTALTEAVHALHAVTVAAHSDGRVRRVPPLPRPVTAVERVKARRGREIADHVRDTFLPREETEEV